MSKVVFKCRRHGDRTEEQVYRSNDKATIRGFRYKCKECTYAATRARPCKVHGMIGDDDRLETGRCKICSLSAMNELNEVRNRDRAAYNEKLRLKQEANPEYWANKYKKKHGYKEELHSIPGLTRRRVANKFKMTTEQLKQMFIDQDDKCYICKQAETRVYKDKLTKEMKVAKLCVDHNHLTGEVRKLLCYACNTSLGLLKENEDTVMAMLKYIIEHK